jgi:hypothetical protein
MRYVLLGLFACFEIANFTGFSWTRLRRLSDEELITTAIQYHYRDVYPTLADFKADYASFQPGVYYWDDLTGEAGNQFFNKLVGWKRFNVRLPDAVVVIAANGVARLSRRCGENSLCSPAVPPDHPVLGIIGIAQDGPPNYDVAQAFSVRWTDGSEGSVLISGHCFAALSRSPKPVLRIAGANGDDVVTIRDAYGYRLVTIPDIKRAAYGSLRISQQQFAQSQGCDKAFHAAWPNIGGKR